MQKSVNLFCLKMQKSVNLFLAKIAEIRKFVLHLSEFLFFSTLSVYFFDSNSSMLHSFEQKQNRS